MSTTITTAARQYANRPKDERFESTASLIAAGEHDKTYSKEVTYNLRDLAIYPSDEAGLVLTSPKGQASFTNWSFGQLSRMVGAPAGYLRGLPQPLPARSTRSTNRAVAQVSGTRTASACEVRRSRSLADFHTRTDRTCHLQGNWNQ